MKCHIQNLTMLSAVIAFASCNSNKTESQTETSEQTEAVATETDTTLQESAKPSAETKIIDGVVKEIARGKDGYTATIQTNDDAIYLATISRANLNDPQQYRDFNTNEIVKLSGDFWQMENTNRLTVREIK